MEGSAEKTQRQAADTSSELDELTYTDTWPAANPQHQPRRTVWDAVSSAGARRMLREAYRLARLKDHSNSRAVEQAGLHENYDSYYVGPAVPRRLRVRGFLQRSDLARLLPGGFGSLPDIYAAAPPWAAALLRLMQPNTCEQLLRFVARNLNWYLNPTSTRVNPLLFLGVNSYSVTGLSWLLCFASLSFLHDEWMFIPLLLSMIVTIGVSLPAVQSFDEDADIWMLELYLYLRDAWADPEE